MKQRASFLTTSAIQSGGFEENLAHDKSPESHSKKPWGAAIVRCRQLLSPLLYNLLGAAVLIRMDDQAVISGVGFSSRRNVSRRKAKSILIFLALMSLVEALDITSVAIALPVRRFGVFGQQ